MDRALSTLLACLILLCPLLCGGENGECAHTPDVAPGTSHHHSEGNADNCVCEGAIRTDDASTLQIEGQLAALPAIEWHPTPLLDAEPLSFLDAPSHPERASYRLADAGLRLRC